MKNIELTLTPTQANYIERALNDLINKQLTRASRGREQGSTVFSRMRKQQAEIGKGILKELQKARA